MPWLQLKIDTDQDQVERLSEILTEAGAAAVTLEDRADQPLYEPPPGATPLWQQVVVIGLFQDDYDVEGIAQALDSSFDTPLNWHIEALEDQDWERAWMDMFEPMRFGARLWICPSWHTPPDPQAVNLRLDPGLAFGTGTHPTTALCLEWLDAHAPAGLEVIDYGCGSGILALAALKLGAHHATGIDNDPQALVASRHNAQQNDVAGRLSLFFPDQAQDIEPADVLLANILAKPLIELAPQLAALTRPGGHIVLSGILAEQAQEVSDAYAPFFDMSPPVQREDWIRLDGHRK